MSTSTQVHIRVRAAGMQPLLAKAVPGVYVRGLFTCVAMDRMVEISFGAMLFGVPLVFDGDLLIQNISLELACFCSHHS